MKRVIWGDMSFLVRRSLYMARGTDAEDSQQHLIQEAIDRHNGKTDHNMVGVERQPSHADWR